MTGHTHKDFGTSRLVRVGCIWALGVGFMAISGLAAAKGLSLEHELGAPVSAEALDSQRGQADSFYHQSSAISEQGAVFGNHVDSSPSGMNTIHSGALRDNHGLTTVIQNSGHHVLIQEATNINVSVTP